MTAVRRLAAIMFTDVVGFTASTHADEARSLEQLVDHERLVRPILRRHRGREVKTIGDAFLVEFASALDACRCALEIQTRLREGEEATPSRPAFRLRIGIHLGDIVHREGDVFGDAVNIASRVEGLAEPGGICVSQQVADQVANKLDRPLVRLAGAELRNVATPIGVYKIDLPRVSIGPPATVTASPAPRRRLAVLPMENLSHVAEEEYLADGFTEELILRIARVPGLHVLARTSIVRYRETTKSPGEIARELGVEALLEGSVRAQGDKLRVTATLVDPQREEPLWAEAYDRELTDLFEVQREIAERIAAALRVEFSRETRERVGRPLTQSAEAYTCYLRGRFLWNQRTSASLAGAVHEYSEALTRDPPLALAHAGIADAYAAQALLEMARPAEAFPRSRAAAERALALDPQCTEALTSLAVVRFQYDRDWAGSEQAFRAALALNPSYAPAHHQFADLLKALGRFDEALAEIRTALDLDPLSLAINTGVGHVLYLARRYDEAIAQYRRTLELDPGFVQAHLWFGRPFLEKGMFSEAIAELERAVTLSEGSTISLASLAHAYAAAGQGTRARTIVRQLLARARTTYVPSYWIGLVYVGLGDRPQAFRWLERAFRERSSWLTWAMVEPRFDPLRSDRRFARLLARMDLAPGGAVPLRGRPRSARRRTTRPLPRASRRSGAAVASRRPSRPSARRRPPPAGGASSRKPRLPSARHRAPSASRK